MEIEHHDSQKFLFFLYLLSGDGGWTWSLTYPASIGAYGLDASIIMKFGFNATNGVEIELYNQKFIFSSLFAFGGLREGTWSLSIETILLSSYPDY